MQELKGPYQHTDLAVKVLSDPPLVQASMPLQAYREYIVVIVRAKRKQTGLEL